MFLNDGRKKENFYIFQSDYEPKLETGMIHWRLNEKKNIKNILGLTLVEILIGIVVSSLMMAAMYTTYSIVNNTYNQVVDKAKISRSSRDLVSMLIRDVRMSGFKYYLKKMNKKFG